MTLSVYNSRGKTVKILVDNELHAGNHRVMWDGRDNKGRQVSTGVYSYELRIGDHRETKMALLLR